MVFVLGGCGLASFLVIPTLFATQSRLQGCPDTVQILGDTVELTFEIFLEDGTTTDEAEELTWSMMRGVAEIDDSNNNPAVVTLTEVGIITIRADYISETENVNPATCSVVVQNSAE